MKKKCPLRKMHKKMIKSKNHKKSVKMEIK